MARATGKAKNGQGGVRLAHSPERLVTAEDGREFSLGKLALQCSAAADRVMACSLTIEAS